ncbi:hypothetical protein TPHA_0I01750 [Tetrapisispora phaffii CBS 4417]|uniref:Translocation protein SEC62 n=1 Tax=Tetrapisispora phaffii (strain ATCC 24235 / CBS 4417 / NBRC 1672 / NRRL Y-8282 / UCD 70-5) TaxID=1071381 RepID=G8BXQ1_TETPH|nr:hypothetical protein TPHA_0I01750 [Tetrapisispora phaffii CBS 4417]CCE64679.1 hypothetical protein TPHA_0I01750 [Tetrapisispora phaffii CBS 4417]
MSDISPDTPLAVAKLLRRNSALKQRVGLLQGKPVEFFRYKRFVRAIKSNIYTKKSLNQPELYPIIVKNPDTEKAEDYIFDEDKIKGLFVTLIRTQLIVPIIKLHSNEAKEHGLKPNKDHPNLIITQKAALNDDAYYSWNYNPKTWKDIASLLGIVAFILTLVCFPLWPLSMRRGSYYLSLAALGLLGLFFIVAILRLVTYLVSLVFIKSKGGFWLFPNLFEDCGVLESFKPLYGYGDEGNYTYIKKLKRKKKKQASKNASTTKKAIKSKTSKKLEEIKDE